MRREAAGEDRPPCPLGEPEGTPPAATTRITPHEERWDVKRDLVGYGSELEIVKDAGTLRFDDIGLDVGRRAYERYTAVADATLDGYEGDRRVFSRTWNETLPRDCL